MRSYIRENLIYHGNYLDVNICPVFAVSGTKGSRRKKAKPTSEVQQLLNERYARKRIVYLINNNFTSADYALHLSYDNLHLPIDFDGAVRQVKNFIRRLKRALKKKGIELKYFSVDEESPKGRLHHHLIISGGLAINEIAESWGNGYIQVKPLQFNEFGIADLANYITKEANGRKRISHSRNLKQPDKKQKDSRISKKKIKDIAGYNVDVKDECRMLYPGYELADMEPYYNDVNGNYYITLRLYKLEIFDKRRKRKTS